MFGYYFFVYDPITVNVFYLNKTKSIFVSHFSQNLKIPISRTMTATIIVKLLRP